MQHTVMTCLPCYISALFDVSDNQEGVAREHTAKIYDAITSLLLHKCCTLNLTTTSLHLIVVY